MDPLPTELITTEILSKLSLTDLVHYCQTNKLSKKLCESDDIFRIKVERQLGKTRKPKNITWKQYYFDLLARWFIEKIPVYLELYPYQTEHLIGQVTVIPFETTWRDLIKDIGALLDRNRNIPGHEMVYQSRFPVWVGFGSKELTPQTWLEETARIWMTDFSTEIAGVGIFPDHPERIWTEKILIRALSYPGGIRELPEETWLIDETYLDKTMYDLKYVDRWAHQY